MVMFHTEETKRKMREKRKLQPPPRPKGYFLSEETKKKMSDFQKGRKHSKEQIEKFKLTTRGQKRGEKNPNWRGGITTLKELIRKHWKYREWRSDIFTRDNFTCQNCGEKSGEIEAHHKKSFSDILKEYNIKSVDEALICEELWSLNNGETLCKECHKKTDNYGSKNNKKRKEVN